MEMRRFLHNSDAVAGVIEALLLVALVSVVISTIQLVYIPEIMKQREAEHMDDVENQLSYLKSIIDLQSTVQEDVPVSSPLTLGSRELPYFVTARSFGHLIIRDVTASKIDTEFFTNQKLTSIEYEAVNAYYIDQTYVLEGGSLIVNQSNGQTARVEPSMTYENRSTEIRINYNLPTFNGIEGKNTTSGYKSCFIRTNYSSKAQYSGYTNYIKIYTEYLNAWNNSLNQLFSSEVDNGYININKYPTANPPYVAITEGTKDLYLELTVINFGVQIGPGTVLQ